MEMNNTTTCAAAKWTRPENCWGPTGEHHLLIGNESATVFKTKGPGASGWTWRVVNLDTRNAAEGHAPSWQAARKAAEAEMAAR